MNIHLRMKVRGKGPAELQAHICCLAGTGWQTVKGQLPLSDSAWFSTMNIAWYTRASTACRAKTQRYYILELIKATLLRAV